MRNYLFFILFVFFTNVFSQKIINQQFIFPPQEKHVHASSIVECPNGDLLACWFHGSGERTATDVVIQGARLKKGAKEWSPVFLMADTPNLADCNPVLFIDKQNKLWLFWIAVPAGRWEQSILRYRTSTDYQKIGPPHWDWQNIILLQPGNAFAETIKSAFDKIETEEPIWAEYAPTYSRMIEDAAKDPVKRQTGWMTRIHPTVLPSGRILLPLYSDGFNLSLVAMSDDEGKNWFSSLPIVGFGPTQPTIRRRKDGTLIAYLRDSGNPPGRVQVSISKDNGRTWTPTRDTDIPNPDSSLEVLELKDGRWVMVFNDTEDGRYQLALALSDDQGKTWKWKRHLEKVTRGKGSFAYPSIIQDRDGKLNLTYSYGTEGKQTIKYVKLDVNWISEGND